MKKYYINRGEFANQFNLYYAENDEDKKVISNHADKFEPITRTDAVELLKSYRHDENAGKSIMPAIAFVNAWWCNEQCPIDGKYSGHFRLINHIWERTDK